MARRKNLTVKPVFDGIDLKNPIASPANLKKYPWLAKIAEDMRRSAGFAAYHGAKAMREKILDSPIPDSYSHRMVNARRGNPPNARYETGTMYNSVSFNRGSISHPKDQRRRGSVSAGFGWPADENGIIKDAPTSPIGRQPDGAGWRDDPKYFMMQEYGFPHEGRTVPGMFSQRAGVEAAKIALNEELKRRGYK